MNKYFLNNNNYNKNNNNNNNRLFCLKFFPNHINDTLMETNSFPIFIGGNVCWERQERRYVGESHMVEWSEEWTKDC